MPAAVLPAPDDKNLSEENPKEDIQKDGTEILKSQKYDAAQIDKLEGLEAVRKRPGMYIGDPDERGLHHLVFEVLDNSIDEHLAGYCTKIEVTVHVDGSVSVRDNGRGIPVDARCMPKWKMPAVELVLTNLHAGGKFGQGAYKYSGGLHGVGAKCVNALSDWFKVEVTRDGKVYHMAFAKGKTTDKLTVIGEVKNKKNTGTLITFLPDPTIFTITTEFKFERLASRLRELAFLNPGLEIILSGRTTRAPKKETFFYKYGIEEFVKQLGENKQVIHPKPVVISRQRDEVFVDVVMQYNDSYNDQILPFANSIPNPDGGTHLTGFRTALTKAVNQYAEVEQSAQRQGPGHFRRRRARRFDLRPEHQAAEPALRIADQGEARQHRDRRHRQLGRLRRADDLLRSESAGRETHFRQGSDRRPRARSRLARPAKRFAKARSPAAVCRANWPTVPSAIRN